MMASSCAPMFKFFSAPPDGAITDYEISNPDFQILSARIIVIF